MIEATKLLQWALYYPAVIDPAEWGDSPAAGTPLSAYAEGNLLEAVKLLPGQPPREAVNRSLQAADLLAVGRADEARDLLGALPAGNTTRRALERVIAAVKFEEQPDWDFPNLPTASEALADSYYLQSRSRLEEARQAARRATELSPGHGHAWVRLAELEFSFGHTRAAKEALGSGLERVPQNAQAHALQGFILSAENRIAAARYSFQHAVRLDGALGNGGLGLGLTKIKRGEVAEGREELQTAATVEPLQSIYHSYLGKVFSAEGRREDARRDLDLARRLDPNDPTPWLYSAIESQQHNETNRAIGEMRESIRVNDNRRVYRSQFLLDQERAVRSANLARIYQNNGMNSIAVWEATRAVHSDYTNASAHLFLSNAFNAQRDPTRISLRYEPPWFNELLLSNLLFPVGGGPLSQYVSQQEYSKLLESDGVGPSVNSEWRDTDEVRSVASVFGTGGNLSFGIDYGWRDAPGFHGRPNNDADLDELFAQVKWHATPDNIFNFLGKWAREEHGDIFETYDNKPLAPEVRFEEDQQPGLLLGGWNHRWGPGSHTLLLAGRLNATQRLTDPRAGQLLLSRDDAALLGALAPYLGTGEILGVGSAPFAIETERQFEIYSAELPQIQQLGSHTLLGGGRFQTGEFQTRARMSVLRPTFSGGFSTPSADQDIRTDFERLSLYAYDFWSPSPWLTLIGGTAWDHVEHPDNFRNPLVNAEQREDERLSGKAGLILTPSRWYQLRGAFTQGLGGVTKAIAAESLAGELAWRANHSAAAAASFIAHSVIAAATS